VVAWLADQPTPGTSDASFPLAYGLDATAWLDTSHSTTTLAVVPPGADLAGPAGRGLWLASVTWDPAAGHAVYRVEREEHVDRIPDQGGAPPQSVGIRIEDDGRVSFLADGAPRWRSSLRVTGGGSFHHRARVHLEGAVPTAVTRLEVTVGSGDRR
jgi:hypothetical protein